MHRFLIFVAAALIAQTPSSKPSANGKPAAAKSSAASPVAHKSAAKAEPAKSERPNPEKMTDDEKTVYALGLSIARSISQFDLSAAELALLAQALSDSASGKPVIDLNTWGPKIQTLARDRAARVTERQKSASEAYIAKAAAEPGAVKTDSGLVYRELTAGTGTSPKATDTVKVNYRGTLVDGTEFDSSYSRNEPAQFALNGVIPCWTEGLQKMKVGGKAILVCPSNLAYGDAGRPSIPGGAALTFEIELLGIPSSTP